MTEQPVEGGRLYVEVVSDVAGFRRDLQTKLDTEIRGIRADIQARVTGTVVFDRAQIRRELATKVAQAAREVKAQISVEADVSRARETITRFRQEQERNPIRPPVRPETDKSSLARIGSEIASFGESLTGLFQFPMMASGVALLAGAAVNLAGGLAAVAASASQAIGVLAALPGLASVAAQGMGTLMLGFSGIGEAVKALGKSHQQAGVSAGKSAAQQVNAAAQIKSAQDRLAEARKSAAQRVAEAQQQAAERVAAAQQQAAERIARADRAVADAQRGVKQAQEELTAARAKAREEIEQLSFSLRESVLSEEQAEISLERAQAKVLAARQSATMSPLDKRQAELDYKQAILDLEEAKKRASDLAAENKKAAKEGVEGSDTVRSAKARLSDANRALRDAENEATKARRDGAKEVAKAQAEGARDVAKARAEGAAQIKAAQDAVRQAMASAGQQAAATGASINAVGNALDKLSPAGQRFAKFIAGTLKPKFDDLRKSIQEAMLPGIQRGITAALPLLDVLKKHMTATGKIIGGLAVKFGKMAGSAPFRRDTATIMSSNNRALSAFGEAGLHFANALRDIMVVASPMVEKIAQLVLRFSKFAEAQTKAGRASNKMAAFFDRAWRTASQLAHILGDVVVGLFNVFRQGTPAGNGMLDSLAKAAERFRKATSDPKNQQRFKKFFDDTVPLMQHAGDALKRIVGLLLRLGEATGGGTLDPLFTVLNLLLSVLSKLLSMPGSGAVLSTIFLLATAGAGLGLVAKGLGKIVENLGKISKYTGLSKLLSKLGGGGEGGGGGGGGGGEGGGGPLEKIKAGWEKVTESLGKVKEAAQQVRDGFNRAKDAAIQAGKAAGRGIKAGAQAAGRGIATGAAATGRGAKAGAKATGRGAAAAGRGIKTAAVTVGAAAVTGARAAGAALATAASKAALAARNAALFTGNLIKAGAAAAATGIRTAASAIASTATAAARGAVALGSMALAYVRTAGAAALAAVRTVLFTTASLAARAATAAWAAVTWVLDAAMSANPLGAIILIVMAVVGAFVLAYTKISWFRNGVNALFAWIRDHWQLLAAILFGPFGIAVALIVRYWSQIKSGTLAAVNFIVGWVKSHWRLLVAIVTGPLGAIVVAVVSHWSKIKNAFGAALSWVLSKARAQLSLITGAFSRAWSAVVNTTTSWASTLHSKVSSLMSRLHSAFSSGVSKIGSAWDKLRSATKAPVNFLIGTVYNRGIVGLWNKVMGWLHIPGMHLGTLGLLASGGTLNNPANAVPMQVNRPMAIVGEGRPQYPEFVIPTDPRYRGRAQALWAAAGSKLQMMAGGGVLGGFLGTVKKIAGKVVDVGKAGLDLIAHPGAIWDRLAGPVMEMAKGIGGSPWGEAIRAIPKKIMDTAKGAALSVVKAFNEGFGGGGSTNVVEAARKYIGVPYVWGGTSHSGIDCSGLTMRAWSDGAHKNITRTTYSQRGYLKTIPGPRPGSPGQPHAGHTYLASRVQGGRVWVVEAAHTGTNVSEHLLTRPTPWWGWPPGMAAGGILKRLGERYVKSGDQGSQLARYLGVAGDPGGIAVGYPGPKPGAPAVKRDSGGPLPPGTWAFNGLTGTEWVLTPEAVDYLGGDRAVAAINAVAARRAHSPAEPMAPAAAAGPTAQVIVNPQPKQSETEIGMVAARKIGVMLS